jgi:outer membrane protein assembly factor BamB
MKITIIVVLILHLFYYVYANNEPVLSIEHGFQSIKTVLSPSEKYLLISDEQQYQVWDMERHKSVLAGNYRYRISNWLSGSTVHEGSGFLLFEHKNLFLTVEYTLNNARIKAFNIQEGSKIWENDEVSLGISWMQSLLSLVQTASRGPEIEVSLGSRGFSQGQFETFLFQDADPQMIAVDPAIDRFIHYISDLNAIVINGNRGLQMLDLKTGQLRWTQQEINTALGEVLFAARNERLIAVSIHSSELEGLTSRPNIYAIDAETGDIIWTKQYIGNYKPDRSFILGDQILLTDYFGLSMMDIENGEKPDNSLNENYSRAEDALRMLTRLQPTSPINTITSDPLFDKNHHLYYVVGTHRGSAHPMTGNKVLQKINPVAGTIIYQSATLGGTNDVPVHKVLKDDVLYVKMARRNQTYIHALRADNGELMFTTERIRNRHDTEFDPFYLHANTLVDLSSISLHFYDNQTGQEINKIELKDAGFGRLNTYLPYSEGFVITGNRGIVLTDKEGNIKQHFDMGDIIHFTETDDKLYLVDNRKLKIVDKADPEQVSIFSYQEGENISLGHRGRIWLHSDRQIIHIYGM